MQNNLLAVETTGLYPTVSILKDGNIHEKSFLEELNHLRSLAPMVKSLMDELSMESKDINGILMSSGPGSFTGIRIGLAFGKAFSLSLGIKCYTESSLKMLGYQNRKDNALICPLLDGRKGRVFSALYRGSDMEVLIEEGLCHIDECVKRLNDYSEKEIIFVGDGVFPNYSELSNFKEATFIDADFLKSSTILKYYLENSKKMTPLNPEEIDANYLRKSEAELMRKSR